MAGGKQVVDRRLVEIGPLRLVVGAKVAANARPLVPVDPQPFQTFENRRERRFHVPLLVGVVDPQDEPAAVAAGEKPTEQGCADPPNVKVTGRTWSETGANGHEVQVLPKWGRR